ncbi:hypothetical protein BDB00DRAFT_889835 [Zychaea mexicana]|uniref:uncharacterized protein n=1 Tax=Zychaea mexicana TaxID=64656 RepID=UPI0022FDCA17|nr:uncharacterized protein BDB00DRAFT_889835 [Zychaea mexicana]KAI9496897.1 hypothetical protein BDB00DRAFT_889835 [Zychaea mexicana]
MQSMNKDENDERIIQVNHTNTTTQELLSPAWDAMLCCVGEKVMRRLLKDTIMLARIDNGPRINVVVDCVPSTVRSDVKIDMNTYSIIPGRMMYNKRFDGRPRTMMKENSLEQLKIMFPNEFSKRSRKFPKRLDTVNNIVEQIIQKNARSKPMSALAHTCARPKDGPMDKMTTSPNAIYQFAVKQVKRVFPIEFWGSERNLLLVLKVIRQAMNLRKRETLDLKDALREFNSYFYVTESSTVNNRMSFFHADIWKQKTQSLVDGLVEKRYERVAYTPETVASLRIVPKGASMRPITNMNCFDSIDQGLLLEILKEKLKEAYLKDHVYLRYFPTISISTWKINVYPLLKRIHKQYVDDFLLVTPNKDTIEKFCKFIYTGADRYGTTFSAAKSVTTANVDSVQLWTETG